VLHEQEGADITLISTGSEVCICIDAVKELAKQNIKARVVSIPCFEVFDAQSKDYRLSVLPDGIPSLSVEVMSTMGWERYAHEQFGLNRKCYLFIILPLSRFHANSRFFRIRCFRSVQGCLQGKF